MLLPGHSLSELNQGVNSLEAQTQKQTFSTKDFQIHLLNAIVVFHLNVMDLFFSNQPMDDIIGKDSGPAPNRWQGIISTNDDTLKWKF